MNIPKIVQKLVKKFDTTDPFQLADYLNITILKKPLGDLAGMYLYMKRNKVIILNSDLDYEFLKIVLAHEIGHAILHRQVNCYFMRKNTYFKMSLYEVEANTFAAELLLYGLDKYQYENCSLEFIAKSEKIPLELIKYKNINSEGYFL